MSELTFDEIREKLNKVLSFGIYTKEAGQYVSGLLEAVIQRAEAANARVAELEAAQQWRPVDDPPLQHDAACQVIVNAQYVHSNRPEDENAPGTWLGEAYHHLSDIVLYWRPIPQENP